MAGPAVLIVHHPPKGATRGGQASRGTGALPAFVDFLVEMHWSGPATSENRRRRLLAWSRHDETPRRVLVELSAAGTDYAVLPAGSDEPDDETQRLLEGILSDPAGLTVREIIERWPPGTEPPSPRSLRDRLWELVALERLERLGRGVRFAPFRYRVAERKLEPEALATELPSPGFAGEGTGVRACAPLSPSPPPQSRERGEMHDRHWLLFFTRRSHSQ
jgi:hypothetical protein